MEEEAEVYHKLKILPVPLYHMISLANWNSPGGGYAQTYQGGGEIMGVLQILDTSPIK